MKNIAQYEQSLIAAGMHSNDSNDESQPKKDPNAEAMNAAQLVISGFFDSLANGGKKADKKEEV